MAKQLQRKPYDVKSREKFYILKMDYKAKIKEKKRKYKQDILAELASSGKNSKHFGKSSKSLIQIVLKTFLKREYRIPDGKHTLNH